MKRLCNGNWFPAIVLALVPGIAAAGNGAPVVAPVPADVVERLERIERKLDNQSLLDLYNQVQQLQQEVQKLRGEIDSQRHRLEQMTQRQKDLYADIDTRLQELENAGPSQTGETIGGFALETELPVDPGDPDTAAEPEADSDVAAGDEGGEEPAATDATQADPRAAYDQAFDRLKGGEYPQASEAFRKFLQDHPRSEFADNARYWLGEVYYVTGDFEQAIEAYQQLLQDYPDSQKAPHAMLKIGYSQQELGEADQAVNTLEELRRQYPDTTAASLARERLQQMRAAGT